jgi:hypothetical protein
MAGIKNKLGRGLQDLATGGILKPGLSRIIGEPHVCIVPIEWFRDKNGKTLSNQMQSDATEPRSGFFTGEM